jgi:hypothetical protein
VIRGSDRAGWRVGLDRRRFTVSGAASLGGSFISEHPSARRDQRSARRGGPLPHRLRLSLHAGGEPSAKATTPRTVVSVFAAATPPIRPRADFETSAIGTSKVRGLGPQCASDSAQKLLAETHRWPNATRHHLSPTGASPKSSRESRSSYALRNQNGRREPPPLNLLGGLFCQGAFGLSSQR